MRARIGLLVLTLAAPAAAEDWPTYRGNPQRTGNTDGKPGPAAPTVLWAVKSKSDQYIASPVPVGTNVLFSALGAFNKPSVYAFPVNPKDPEKPEPVWTKSAPYLKLPTVSSPAWVGGHLVFGDGMHQTDGAVLHCLPEEGGQPIWQLTVPGELVHLEGGPSVAGGRVYVGGGAAGVMCVELEKATLDGKDYDLATVKTMQAAKWKKLLADYEVEKKKDPDFAVPPSEDSLLKFTPKAGWQVGKTKWHVDAPVAVVGGKVYAASAYLDKEKVGLRAVVCLDAADGKELWKAPLGLNPWGGASVSEDAVVATASSISYDFKALDGAKGEVVCLDPAKGDVRWRKTFNGGVESCAALTKDMAIFTCTDGKVRGLALKDGERKFLYDCKAPLFAPPAVVGGVAYVGDLNGVVHAIDIKTGAAVWTLDLGAAPLKAPGAIYGGPVVRDGKVFLATCNLEGPNAQKETVALCIGAK